VAKHTINFHDKKSRHTECAIRKAIESELHHDNMNRKEGFLLSKSWKPLVQTLKEQKKDLSKEKSCKICHHSSGTEE